jgi:hypothetical protein
VVSFQGNGQEAPKEKFKDWRIVIADDKMKVAFSECNILQGKLVN